MKNNFEHSLPQRESGEKVRVLSIYNSFYSDPLKNKKEGRKQSRPPAFPQKTRKIPPLFWGREYEKQLINIKTEKK